MDAEDVQYGDGSGFQNPDDYQIDAVVKQFARLNSADQLKLVLVWKLLRSISSIASFQLTSLLSTFHTILRITIEEFTVTFQVQYWAPDNSAE